VKQAYRYPAGAMAADYARSLAGLLLSVGPLWVAHPAPGVVWVLSATAALFLVYFLRTVARNTFRIELDEAGIRADGLRGAEIRWEQLRSVRLRYYSTRGDRSGGGGWMQLDLRGASRGISVDSSLTGFAEIARASAREATRRGCMLDEATLANLGALERAPKDGARQRA
jgi:hypothetical protein